MSYPKFKLTAVAALVLVAANANAAIYKVELSTPIDDTTMTNYEAYGKAIEKTTGNVDDLGCFADGSTCTSYALAGNTVLNSSIYSHNEGIGYREEVPFGTDNSFSYIDDQDDFQNYCENFISSDNNSCEGWAREHFNRYIDDANSKLNSQAFINNTLVENNGSSHAIVNSLLDSNTIVGNKSIDNDKIFNQAFFPGSDNVDFSNYKQTRAWKTDGTYTVGSVSTEKTNDNGNFHASEPAIWQVSGNVTTITSGQSYDNYLKQGSFRDFYLDDSNHVLTVVGYNSVSADKLATMRPFIAQYKNLDAGLNTPQEVYISGFSDTDKYRKSVATAINENGLVIGYGKFTNANGGAYPNKSFTTSIKLDGSSLGSPSAAFFNNTIFNGSSISTTAESVNNFNEIVGKVDEDESRVVERGTRGFIYPFSSNGVAGTISDRAEIFKNRAWWLDDLTNDGNVSSENNAYRIIDASDINDDGVIAASARMCTSNGAPHNYERTAYNSECSGPIKTVAVKLIPVAGAKSSDIQPREFYYPPIERQGAGLGWLALTVLGLFSFRRRK